MPITNAATVRTRDDAGVRARRIWNYTGPTSYVQPGGDTITAGQLGLGRIELFNPTVSTPSDSNGANMRLISVVYASDGSSVTVRWYTDLTTEVANAVNLSTYTLRIEVAGT
jgi:hypothetical protein